MHVIGTFCLSSSNAVNFVNQHIESTESVFEQRSTNDTHHTETKHRAVEINGVAAQASEDSGDTESETKRAMWLYLKANVIAGLEDESHEIVQHCVQTFLADGDTLRQVLKARQAKTDDEMYEYLRCGTDMNTDLILGTRYRHEHRRQCFCIVFKHVSEAQSAAADRPSPLVTAFKNAISFLIKRYKALSGSQFERQLDKHLRTDVLATLHTTVPDLDCKCPNRTPDPHSDIKVHSAPTLCTCVACALAFVTGVMALCAKRSFMKATHNLLRQSNESCTFDSGMGTSVQQMYYRTGWAMFAQRGLYWKQLTLNNSTRNIMLYALLSAARVSSTKSYEYVILPESFKKRNRGRSVHVAQYFI